MRRWVIALVVPVIAAFGLTACGASKSTDTTTSAAATTAPTACPTTTQKTLVKTRFASDLGLIIGTTKHFIVTPYSNGAFAKGAKGRLVAITKAGAAALAADHLVKNAISNAEADPMLCKALVQPLKDVDNTLSNLKSKLLGGDTSTVSGLNGSLGDLSSGAKGQGLSVVEKIIPGI